MKNLNFRKDVNEKLFDLAIDCQNVIQGTFACNLGLLVAFWPEKQNVCF